MGTLDVLGLLIFYLILKLIDKKTEKKNRNDDSDYPR